MSAHAAAAKVHRGVPATISHEMPLPAWMALHPGYQHELKSAIWNGDTVRAEWLSSLFVKPAFGGTPIPRAIDLEWLFAGWMNS